MALNRWLSIVDAFGTIVLGLSILATVGVATFLVLTPALPVLVSIIDKPTPPAAGAPQRAYHGDDTKGREQK